MKEGAFDASSNFLFLLSGSASVPPAIMASAECPWPRSSSRPSCVKDSVTRGRGSFQEDRELLVGDRMRELHEER